MMIKLKGIWWFLHGEKSKMSMSTPGGRSEAAKKTDRMYLSVLDKAMPGQPLGTQLGVLIGPVLLKLLPADPVSMLDVKGEPEQSLRGVHA